MKLTELTQLDAYRIALDELRKMYETDNGKKFIHHLIYAFQEKHLRYIILTNKPIYDSITRGKLVSVFNSVGEMPERVKSLFDLFVTVTDPDEKVSLESEISELITNSILLTGRTAVKSSESNKILGRNELQALRDFITEQVDEGNQTIYNMVKYIDSQSQVTESSVAQLRDKFHGIY